MAYRLRHNETLSDNIRRIADEQMRRAVELLRTSGEDLEEAVHDARKCFKKIRAVLRLVRSEIGKKTYRRENTRFRDAGRDLSAARDSVVRIRTLESLQEYLQDHPERFEKTDIDFAPIQAYFAGQYDVETRQLNLGGKILKRVIKKVKKSRKAVTDWPIKHDNFRAIRPGLLRAYDNGRGALKLAYAEPKMENFHELRKRVKDLWYDVRILRPMRPKVYDPLTKQLKILSDLLGDEHDLSMLSQSLDEPAVRESVGKLKSLRTLINRRQDLLREEIRPLARRIYKRKPKQFLKMIEKDWSRWQGK